MPDHLGSDQRRVKDDEDKDEKPIQSLDEGDIALLKTYGQGPYAKQIKQVEDDITAITKRVNELTGIKESDTGLAPPALWDLAADKQTLHSEQPLQVNLGIVFVNFVLYFGTLLLRTREEFFFICIHATRYLEWICGFL